MGANTDKFMTQIRALIANAAMSVADVEQFSEAARQYCDEIGKQNDIMTQRHNVHFPNGSQTSAGELAIEQDAVYRAAVAKVDAIEPKYASAVQKKMTAKAELRAALQGLSTSVAQFDAYVTAKENKWLGGKKSIPAAKTFITTTKAYVTSCKSLV